MAAIREINTPISVRVQGSGRESELPMDLAPVHVLAVDDDPESLRAVARILKARGFEVDTALGGEDALVKLKNGVVDVMLVDLVMPGMSGFELLKKAKMASARIEVIMLYEAALLPRSAL